MVGLLAWLQKVPWYLIALAVIAATGFAFWIMNQFNTFRERRRRQTKDIETMIRDWLYKNNFTIKNDPTTNAIFRFVARDEQGRPVVISQLKNESFLTLGAKLLISEEDQQRLDPITKDEKLTILEDLRIELALIGVGYEGISHPLRTIIIQEKVPCDDTLTELAFLQKVMFIRRIQVLIGEFLRRAMKLSTQS